LPAPWDPPIARIPQHFRQQQAAHEKRQFGFQALIGEKLGCAVEVAQSVVQVVQENFRGLHGCLVKCQLLYRCIQKSKGWCSGRFVLCSFCTFLHNPDARVINHLRTFVAESNDRRIQTA
jgi:hypothetical protein